MLKWRCCAALSKLSCQTPVVRQTEQKRAANTLLLLLLLLLYYYCYYCCCYCHYGLSIIINPRISRLSLSSRQSWHDSRVTRAEQRAAQRGQSDGHASSRRKTLNHTLCARGSPSPLCSRRTGLGCAGTGTASTWYKVRLHCSWSLESMRDSVMLLVRAMQSAWRRMQVLRTWRSGFTESQLCTRLPSRHVLSPVLYPVHCGFAQWYVQWVCTVGTSMYTGTCTCTFTAKDAPHPPPALSLFMRPSVPPSVPPSHPSLSSSHPPLIPPAHQPAHQPALPVPSLPPSPSLAHQPTTQLRSTLYTVHSTPPPLPSSSV